jgi:hypothetical protein
MSSMLASPGLGRHCEGFFLDCSYLDSTITTHRVSRSPTPFHNNIKTASEGVR